MVVTLVLQVLLILSCYSIVSIQIAIIALSYDAINIPIGYYYDDSTASIEVCPKGHYCVNAIKHSCRGGYYGSTTGLSNENCSGLCSPGWYCRAMATSSKQYACGSDPRFYCSSGSEHRLSVAQGYYAVDYYAGDDHNDGGYSNQVICDRGSYCIRGVKHLCPAGRYGSVQQSSNSSCTGACAAGFYCIAGSTNERAMPCGNSSVYCPEGTSTPFLVSKGYYSVNRGGNDTTYYKAVSSSTYQNHPYNFTYYNTLLNSTVTELKDNITLLYHNYTMRSNVRNWYPYEFQTGQVLCEPGYFCLNGRENPCPGGRYGSVSGISHASCEGVCEAGYYCPIGSTLSKQYECGDASVFCIAGSNAPTPVQAGYYSISEIDSSDVHLQTSERKCEPGYYCAYGIRKKCSKGYYGETFGLVTHTCTGECYPGYYCNEGSTSPAENECGDPNYYCPGFGNYHPTLIDTGYYSIGGTEATRTGQLISPMGYYAVNGILRACSSGRYGSVEGLSSALCSGYCNQGYYCDVASTSPYMHLCRGDNVFCPAQSGAPITVPIGFYTYDYTEKECPAGYYRNMLLYEDESLLDVFSFIGTNATAPCELCPLGTYKPFTGDSLSECITCNSSSSTSSDDRLSCTCTEVLPTGVISRFNIWTSACDYYDVSLQPYLNDSQYSLNGSDSTIARYSIKECPVGYYCSEGVRYKCPYGYYGSRVRESDPYCSGLWYQLFTYTYIHTQTSIVTLIIHPSYHTQCRRVLLSLGQHVQVPSAMR